MANTRRRGEPFETNGLDWNTPLYSTRENQKETGSPYARREPLDLYGTGGANPYSGTTYGVPDYGAKTNGDTPDYYSTVGMPAFQTYNPSTYSGWQTYQENPYQGYKDFEYDPFSYQEFSYDYRTDPLYQMYAEQYTRRGQQAMDDTMSQVAARTGGIASSYAQAAAQGEYNSYMADLAAKIPELQQIARNMYDTDRNFAFDQYRDQRDVDYNNYLRGYNEDYANWQYKNALAQANVDLNNQYNYANWQLREAARQAAVNQANEAAMQQWSYQQQAANNNAQARQSAADANYQMQIKALQDAANNPTRAQQRESDLNKVENTLIDAMVNRMDQRDIDAMLEEFYRDPDINFTYADAEALKKKYRTKKISGLEKIVQSRNSVK